MSSCICHPTNIASCKTYADKYDNQLRVCKRISHEHGPWVYHCLSPGMKRQIHKDFVDVTKFLEDHPNCNVIARRVCWYKYQNIYKPLSKFDVGDAQDYTCFCIPHGVTELRLPPDSCI